MSDQRSRIKKVDLQETHEYVTVSDRLITNWDLLKGNRVTLYKKGEDRISILVEVAEVSGEDDFIGKVLGFEYAEKDIAKVVAPGEYHEFEFQGIRVDDLIPFKRKNVRGISR